jgi:hypothetical protein
MLYHSKAKIENAKKKRIALRYSLSGRHTTEDKVRSLLHSDRDWALILRACLIAEQQKHSVKEREGQFAGAWVMHILRTEDILPPKNLRTLTSIGLLKRMAVTRTGNRAYYSIIDPNGLIKALKKY